MKKPAGVQVFTHTDDGRDWSKVYPFTVVGCQFGKRVYKEYTGKDAVTDVLYHCENTNLMSAQWIITPIGQCFSPGDFMEAYSIAVGLVVSDGRRILQ